MGSIIITFWCINRARWWSVANPNTTIRKQYWFQNIAAFGWCAAVDSFAHQFHPKQTKNWRAQYYNYQLFCLLQACHLRRIARALTPNWHLQATEALLTSTKRHPNSLPEMSNQSHPSSNIPSPSWSKTPGPKQTTGGQPRLVPQPKTEFSFSNSNSIQPRSGTEASTGCHVRSPRNTWNVFHFSDENVLKIIMAKLHVKKVNHQRNTMLWVFRKPCKLI